MRGYWRMPDETAATLRPGRLPGEVTSTIPATSFGSDDEGYLYFVARGDDIIKSQGRKGQSARGRERALSHSTGSPRRSLSGCPTRCSARRSRQSSFSVRDVRLDARDVQRHCASCLEDFMVPAVVEFATSLPKSDNGKIRQGAVLDNAAGKARVRRARICDAESVRELFKGYAADRRRPRRTGFATGFSRPFETMRKRGVVVAFSGGIDSSVVGALAVRALGCSERVTG